MSKIVTVGNLKGGTGKSTVAVNLACALARPDRSVLLIDADAQGTASAWLTDRAPVAVSAMPLMVARDAEFWVARVMQLRSLHDLVVVDLPPQVGSGIASALLLADLFIVPVTPSGADVKATAKALELLQQARASRGGERPACMLVPSKVDRRTALGRRATTLLDRFGLKIGPTIRQRAAHVEAFDAGTWIGDYAPNSPAHSEIRALARVVERLLDPDQTGVPSGAGPALHDPRPPAELRADGAVRNGAGASDGAASTGAFGRNGGETAALRPDSPTPMALAAAGARAGRLGQENGAKPPNAGGSAVVAERGGPNHRDPRPRPVPPAVSTAHGISAAAAAPPAEHAAGGNTASIERDARPITAAPRVKLGQDSRGGATPSAGRTEAMPSALTRLRHALWAVRG